MDEIDDAVAAAAFRRLVAHLRHRQDAQNIGQSSTSEPAIRKWPQDRKITQVTNPHDHRTQQQYDKRENHRYRQEIDKDRRNPNGQHCRWRQIHVELAEDLRKLGHDFDHDKRQNHNHDRQHADQVRNPIDTRAPDGRQFTMIGSTELAERRGFGLHAFAGSQIGNCLARQCARMFANGLVQRRACVQGFKELFRLPPDAAAQSMAV